MTHKVGTRLGPYGYARQREVSEPSVADVEDLPVEDIAVALSDALGVPLSEVRVSVTALCRDEEADYFDGGPSRGLFWS